MILDINEIMKEIEENEKKFFTCKCCGLEKNENNRSHLYYWVGDSRALDSCICSKCRELLNGGWLNLEDYELSYCFQAIKNGTIKKPDDYPKFIKKLRG